MVTPGGTFENPQRPMLLLREVQLRRVPPAVSALTDAAMSEGRLAVLVNGLSAVTVAGQGTGAPPGPVTTMTLITSTSGSRVFASTTMPCTAPVPAAGFGTVWA